MFKKFFKILVVIVVLSFLTFNFTDTKGESSLGEKIEKEIQKYVDEKVEEAVKKKLEEKEIEKKEMKIEFKFVKPIEEVEQEKEFKKIKEISRVFGTFEVPEDTIVEGDVSSVFSSGSIDGKVKGDLNLVFSSVYLGKNAEIEGDLSAVFSSVSKHPNVKIKGDKNFVFSPEEGTTKKVKLFKYEWKWIKESPVLTGISILWKILISFGYLIVAILIYLFIPRHLEVMNEAINKNIIITFLFGLLATILIVPVGILLVISIIGILLIPVYVLLIILAVIVGEVVVAYSAGEKISRSLNLAISPLAFLIIGAILLLILGLIPLIGSLMWFVITVLGLGSIVLTKFGTKSI